MKDIQDAVKIILKHLGENPERIELQNTPERFIAALSNFFSGYRFDANSDIKKYRIRSHINSMIVLKDINFISFCEHHILPMWGKINIAYIPNEYIISTGSLLRLVEGCTKKLQLQEKLTANIAEILFDKLGALGVAVTAQAEHSCSMCNANFKMHTTKMIGVFEKEHSKRDEFYSVCSS